MKRLNSNLSLPLTLIALILAFSLTGQISPPAASVTSIVGTANRISVSTVAGVATISIPTNPTLPGNTTGTFIGNITGNVTGNATTATTATTSTSLSLTGVSSSIGGGALLAGACASTTVSITGATTSMPATAGPNTYPGDGTTWLAYVSSSNTVTVKVCATIALTPTASTYNVRVIG